MERPEEKRRQGNTVLWIACMMCLAFSAVVCGCGKASRDSVYISTASDLNDAGFKIGGVADTTSLEAAKKAFPNAVFFEYETVSDAFPALETAKIDAIAFDRPALDYSKRSRSIFMVLPGSYAPGHVAAAAPHKNAALLEKVNEFIRRYREDGTYDTMYARWIKSADPKMPDIQGAEFPTEKLVIATEDQNEPLNFVDSTGRITGFDVEFIKRLALFLNVDYEIRVMPYLDLFTAVENETVDLAVAAMDSAAGKNRAILFSDSYIDCPAALMIRKDMYRIPNSRDPGGIEIETAADLEGKTAAVPNDGSIERILSPVVKNAQYIRTPDGDTAMTLLLAEKVDAVLMDEPAARTFAARYSETSIAAIVQPEAYVFAFPKGSPLAGHINRMIRELKDSGEMETLAAKWCDSDREKKQFEKLPHRNADDSRGTFRFATAPMIEPMSYVAPDGGIAGLDVEIMRRAAHELGMEFEVVTLKQSELLPAAAAGRVNAVGAALSAETLGANPGVEFSVPYYDGGIAVLTRSPHSQYLFGITRLNQLRGKRVGVVSDSEAADILEKHLPNALPFYARNINNLVFLLAAGKIAAFVLDEPQARELLPSHPELLQLNDFLLPRDYAYSFHKDKSDLCSRFSEQIRSMREDGTLAALESKWFSPGRSHLAMPQDSGDEPNGVLRFATVPDNEPFSYMKDGKPVGFDIETAQTIAANLGFSLEIVALRNDAEMFDAVSSGRAAFCSARPVNDTGSKSKTIFTEPVYHGGMVMIVPNKEQELRIRPGFTTKLKIFLREQAYSLDRSIFRDNRLRLILGGLKNTLIIAAAAVAIGSLLGIPLCLLLCSKRKIPAMIARFCTFLVIRTPVLIVLMGFYYVAFGRLGISAFASAVFVFSLRFTAEAARIFQSAMISIWRRQIDAARALCLRRMTVFRRIILPQAGIHLIPQYRDKIVRLLELTTVVGYISVWDLTKVIDWVRGRTFESLYPLVFATILYLLSAVVLIAGVSLIGRLLDPSRRKYKKDGLFHAGNPHAENKQETF